MNAAAGLFPSPGPVSVLSAPAHLAAAIVVFSGHTFVAAKVDPTDVMARLGGDPLVGPVQPSFVAWLSAEVGATAGNLDAVLVANGADDLGPKLDPLADWAGHPRAGHGARRRREVTGWDYRSGQGVILLGRGLCDRWEVAFEAAPDAPPGTGRDLARAALGLVPGGEPVFAQVAVGHARSLRATLAAGYHPIGAEILFS